jgi:hypothetical protein
MFDFLKRKATFDVYYKKIISNDAVRGCVWYKPFTAAYLFVVSDFSYASNYQKRRDNAEYIFSYLRKNNFTSEELDFFDKAVDLYGEIIRREIAPRGDWCFFCGKSENSLHSLFLCFGDLINNPESVNDYKGTPTILKGFDIQMMFATNFQSILELTLQYIKSL